MVGRIDPSALLQQALAQHRSGDVAGAAALYRQLLPHLPDDPLLFLVLGTALGQLGQCEESVVWLGRSLGLAPDQPMALSNRGNALRLLKRHDEALADYDRAIALSPAYAEAHFNRGIALADLKRLDEAVTSFTRAIAIAPDYAEAYFNRGNAFAELRRTAEALADFDRAIALNPRHADAHNNRGCALEKIGRLSEALADYERAITLDPGRAEAHYNRGCVLTKLDRYEDALASYERAIAARPEYADAYCNRGCVLKYLGQFNQAVASFTRAIAIDPNQADAHLNLATLSLALGDFERGWREYEWRWKSTRTPQKDFSQPMWTGGQDVAGKTLLVHTEQGFGDMVFSCRYIPMAAALGAKVVVEGPKRLLPLLKTLKGEYTFIETGEPLPPFDLHCPIMSLPLAFNTRLKSIPSDVPYLFADPDKSSAVSRGLEKSPRIGLVWSGNREHIGDAARSIVLSQLEPILRLPFAFHALQIEIRPEDAATLPEYPGLELHLHDQDGFSDAAALIAAMDLVVTVDTVIAHVAGALGKPVWILLPWLADWRWLLNRSDSPWYPTARLFRQPARGDWDSVIAEVSTQLQRGWA